MELETDITGLQLVEIKKNVNDIKLILKDPSTNVKKVLSFEGYLFESGISGLNRRIIQVNVRNVLGFKAVNQLQYDGVNTRDYKQILFEMEGSFDDNKIELIAVFKKISFSNSSRGIKKIKSSNQSQNNKEAIL